MVINPGWYIVGFHDVSWEASPYLSGIGLTAAPDEFAECVALLAQHTSLIGVEEGFARWKAGTLDKPYVSLWFDDAYLGVRKYALPVLQRHQVTAAVSVNSRFASRTEMFWRAKLSFLSYRDGMRFVRSRLRAHGYQSGQPVRHATMDLFTPAILDEIDAIYQKFTTADDRRDAFRVFDTWDGIRALRDAGWTIANHGARHLPVLETSGLPLLAAEFGECEVALQAEIGRRSDFWVAPFDRGVKRDPGFQAEFDKHADGRTLVLVGNRVNTTWSAGKPVRRISPPGELRRTLDVLAQTKLD